VSVAQALTHYRTCDALKLTKMEIAELGTLVGDKVQAALLVVGREQKEKNTVSDTAVWTAMGAFSRMGRRIYQGGSAQYVRTGPTELQIESLENVLFSVPYYREAHCASVRTALCSIGVEVRHVKIASCRRDGLEVDCRVAW
jgi:hypothetical protein